MCIFAIDDARYGRQMHADVFGDVLQHHRLNVLDALIEELALPVHDRFHDAIYRLPAVLDVSQQIDRRAHLLFYEITRLLGRLTLRKHLLITGTDAQARTAVIGKVDDVITVLIQLLDVDLWRNQDRFFGRIATTRIRIERANELELGDEYFHVKTKLFGQVWQLVLLQSFKVIANQPVRQPFGLAAHLQLREQTLAHIARATTDRIHPHHELTRTLNYLFRPTALRRDFFVARI